MELRCSRLLLRELAATDQGLILSHPPQHIVPIAAVIIIMILLHPSLINLFARSPLKIFNHWARFTHNLCGIDGHCRQWGKYVARCPHPGKDEVGASSKKTPLILCSLRGLTDGASSSMLYSVLKNTFKLWTKCANSKLVFCNCFHQKSIKKKYWAIKEMSL